MFRHLLLVPKFLLHTRGLWHSHCASSGEGEVFVEEIPHVQSEVHEAFGTEARQLLIGGRSGGGFYALLNRIYC